jgi:hypothetical protein
MAKSSIDQDFFGQPLVAEPLATRTLFEQIQITAPELWRTFGDFAIRAYPGPPDREAAVGLVWGISINPAVVSALAQFDGGHLVKAETVLGQTIEALITAIKERRLCWDAVHPRCLKRVSPDPALLRKLFLNGEHRCRNQIATPIGVLYDLRFYDPPPLAKPDKRQGELPLSPADACWPNRDEFLQAAHEAGVRMNGSTRNMSWLAFEKQTRTACGPIGGLDRKTLQRAALRLGLQF